MPNGGHLYIYVETLQRLADWPFMDYHTEEEMVGD